LEQKECGLWVENDPATLAEAVSKISDMPLRDMGLRGRDWMQREFTWDSVGKRMLEVYRESVNS
jgi:glycosyltransferase involved in cell wall biosynthesis